ncbi:hypothetical protein QBC40DRAFT_261106 [Triangularia verruculosa]|uniref:Nephrocystin 3-like N-terminal domain-containing protein n=1 Tax=Triangularia verruculosa TaxID=2587418 RepID=A0AAN6XQK7_9PEZI|nr:hypothetical protein QBC40DRAFT_261106 [Triangularia verruculosa]
MPPNVAANGLTVVVCPPDPLLDVIFVHGFTGDPHHTWSQRVKSPSLLEKDRLSNKIRRIFSSSNRGDSESDVPSRPKEAVVYWPQDLLPAVLPKARVLTYGYDTHIRHGVFGPSLARAQVYHIAWGFLQEIAGLRGGVSGMVASEGYDPRTGAASRTRPILFVAHSLGGIIVKEMLRRSSGCYTGHPHLRTVSECTAGLMFFGTPHPGANPRGILRSVAEGLAKVLGFRINEEIMETLLPTSERLRELRDEFGPLAQFRGWRIHSFQEQIGLQALNGDKVVEDPSSTMDLPGIETTQHIARNHMDMCRFAGPDDVEFRKVAHALGSMATWCQTRDSETDERRREEALVPAEREADARRRVLLKSLAFDRMDARQLAIKDAHIETCKWLPENQQFLAWQDGTKLQDHHGFLWVRGHAGTGKSTLTKFALSREKDRSSNEDTIILSFFFNARGGPLERSVEGLYRALLLQLLEKAPDIIRVLDNFREFIYTALREDNVWSVESLRAIFEEALQGLQDMAVVCYIDALDECDASQIGLMLSSFEDLGRIAVSSGKQVRIFFTSRHYPALDIEKGLKFDLETQQGHTEDIKKYIESKLKAKGHHKADELKQRVQERSNGVFMWVALVVDMPNKNLLRGRIFSVWETLNKIPTDLHSLFYDIVNTRIENPDEKDDLLLSIQWVLYSRRLLQPKELYIGVMCGQKSKGRSTFQLEDWQSFKPSPHDLRQFITDASKGFIEIEGFSSWDVPPGRLLLLYEMTSAKSYDAITVQFIHESVRTFLSDPKTLGKLWPDLGNNFDGQAHETLKRCCQVSLRVDPSQLPSGRKLLSQFPLFKYAMKYVLYHAEQAQAWGIDQSDFLTKFDLAHYVSLWNLLKREQESPSVSLSYLVAKHNYPVFCRTLAMRKGDYLQPGTGKYLCPLFAARAAGSLTATREMMNIHLESNAVCTMENSPAIKTLYHDYFHQCERDPRIEEDFNPGTPKIAWEKIVKIGDETLLFALLTTDQDP